MALSELAVADSILTLCNSMKANPMSDAVYSVEMAAIICNAIKSARVTVSAGIPVQVAPATGTGATNAPGTGSLS